MSKNNHASVSSEVLEEQAVVAVDAGKDKSSAPEIKEGMKWYIVHAYSNCEKYVVKALTERIKSAEKEKEFGALLVPTEEVVEMKQGKKRKIERKFYPGYVFVQMELNDETWHFVRSTPKVLGFIGGKSDNPEPVSAKDIKNILSSVEEGAEKPKPKVLFEVGEVILINDGPFAEFNGTVEEVNYEKSRLSVSVMIFGRGTPVDLEFGQVEKV